MKIVHPDDLPFCRPPHTDPREWILLRPSKVVSYGLHQSVRPLPGYRLHIEMESGSLVIVDLSQKLGTAKYAELADETLFQTATTDGDYVIWGDGRVRLTVYELMEVVLMG